MRLAWFSPLPPARSGIATYSGDLVPRLARDHTIDTFDEVTVRDFAWRARRDPYDLVVYQLGNAPCHDFMWGYLAAHPGLVVVHDARLHHARARDLLAQERFDDYRREFWYDHPEAPRDFVEYAVAGLGGPIYYNWPMLRAVMQSARMVAVHNPRVADDLREEFPGTAIEAIRLGVAAPAADRGARQRVRAALGVPEAAVLFAAYGKITAEKRIAAILRNAEGSAVGGDPPGPLAAQEKELIKRLTDFPVTVREAAERRGPQLLPSYAIRLADDFHRFYHECRVLGDPAQAFRLGLCRATQQVIARSLDLLGIEAPERM